MTYSLKRLSRANLEAAIVKAAHYRDLNQPEEAESICRDVLEESPEDQHALRTLGLALTDGWTSGGGMGLGLSGSKRLVHDFVIRSVVGEGTCVTITRWA